MVSRRLEHYVRRTFAAGDVDTVLEMLDELGDASSGQHQERIQAAAAFIGAGDADMLISALETAATDWRDLLVVGGLGDEDWRHRLDDALGGPLN